MTTFPVEVEQCPNLSCRSARPANGWGELAEPGELLDRTYRVHRRLAIGGAGVTYLAREVGADDAEIGPLLAIKVLYQQRDQGSYLQRLATEAQILQGLNHRRIVECRGFVQRAGHSPYLVTTFLEGGSLLDHLRRVGPLSVPVAAGVGRQVAEALQVAHQKGVIHRDLKPENVLLEQALPAGQVPAVRVADFGIAKVFSGFGDRLTRIGAFVGTPQYAAPEQFLGTAPEPSTDIFALGAMLYTCMTGRPIADHLTEIAVEEQYDFLLRHLPPRLTLDGAPEALVQAMEETLALAMAPQAGDRCDIDVLMERLASLEAGRVPAPSTQGARPKPPQAPTQNRASAPPPPSNPSNTRPTVTRTISQDSSQGIRKSWVFGGIGVLGAAIVAGMVIGVVGLWWISGVPQELSAKEGAGKQLAAELSVMATPKALLCAVPKETPLRVVVTGDGALQEVSAGSRGAQAAAACLAQQLKGVKFSYRDWRPGALVMTFSFPG